MKWRIIIDFPKDGYRNMAIDEALVLSVKKKGNPTLRLYSWLEESISFGYNQRIREILDIEKCLKEGILFVRRPTGGGIVLHSVDFTYSISVPVGFFKDIKEGYLFIQGIIKEFFNSIGIEVTLFTEIRKPNLRGICLSEPNFSDIVVEGRKICGLAVRKVREGVLYQGYMLLYHPGNSIRCILDKEGKDKIRNNSVSLVDLINDFSVEDVINRMVNLFTQKCNAVIGKLDEVEDELATTLEVEKYSTEEWNFSK